MLCEKPVGSEDTGDVWGAYFILDPSDLCLDLLNRVSHVGPQPVPDPWHLLRKVSVSLAVE